MEGGVPSDVLRAVGQVDYPVFYLNYILYPQTLPWRDAIGSVVRFFRGLEFTISRPVDLWRAMGEIVSRINEARAQRLASSAAGG